MERFILRTFPFLVMAFLLGAAGQRWADHKKIEEMRINLVMAKVESDLCTDINKSCNGALLTCISWQVRVKYEIEVTNKILQKAFQ